MLRPVAFVLVACSVVFGSHLGHAGEPSLTELDEALEALDLIRENYVDAVEDEDMLKAAIRGFLEEVEDEDKLKSAAIRGVLGELDEYSGFISARAFNDSQVTRDDQLVGIGIAITLEKGRLLVKATLAGSPAFKAGLQAGDAITTIDGVPVATFREDERMKEAVRRLRGKADTSVLVGIVSQGGAEAKEIRIVRQPLKLESITGHERADPKTWNYKLCEEPKIGYVAIRSFEASTAEDLRKVASEMEGDETKALVIDLRNSPGGIMQVAIDCADIFLDDCIVLDVKGRNNNRTYRAKDGQILKGVPIAILTNSMTASAAEVFAGAMRDHGRAIIVGERTFGKGSVQKFYRLTSGNVIKLTTARFYLPSGVSLHKPVNPRKGDTWGVDPNIGFAVKLTDEEARQYGAFRAAQSVVGEKGVPEFVDRVLQKAMEYLRKQVSE